MLVWLCDHFHIILGQLIICLEKRLKDINVTLEKTRDGYLEKSSELDDLQRKSKDQVR